MRFGRLRYDGRSLERLGAGDYGTVYAHPTRADVVLKVGYGLDQDAAASRDIAAAGAGPLCYGMRTTEDGYGVLGKERVYGTTVGALIAARRFGEAEHTLVGAMLDRLAAARLRVLDLGLHNLMIGHTWDDKTLCAFAIDGCRCERFPENASEEEVRQAVWRTPIFTGRRSYFNGGVEILPLNYLLDHGLEVSRPATRSARWWQAFRDSFSSVYIPPF
ncbi:MAG: hypothetical protein HY543_02020 [Deltaproteobacteria bacterium]|nr:hypothetical protein [Deltaproteobacteria bacterium]